MLPPKILEVIDELVGQVQTEEQARLIRGKVIALKAKWRQCYPHWHTDPEVEDVDAFLATAVEQLDALIACHGQC